MSNICLTGVSFFYQTEGTLVHLIIAYTALYLGGTPSQRTGTTPLAVYSSTTVYSCVKCDKESKTISSRDKNDKKFLNKGD